MACNGGWNVMAVAGCYYNYKLIFADGEIMNQNIIKSLKKIFLTSAVAINNFHYKICKLLSSSCYNPIW